MLSSLAYGGLPKGFEKIVRVKESRVYSAADKEIAQLSFERSFWNVYFFGGRRSNGWDEDRAVKTTNSRMKQMNEILNISPYPIHAFLIRNCFIRN